MKRKELRVRIFIKIGEEYFPWESFSPEEKEEIGIELNDKIMRSQGFVRVEETA